MARRTNAKPVKAKAVIIENPIDSLSNKVLIEHTQAIYQLADSIRQHQYLIAYHLHEISVADVTSDGFADVFEFSNKMFGFEKNYTYKMINVWNHFGVLNDDGNASSKFLTDGSDFSISNLIELNQFDEKEVNALINAGIITTKSTQKQLREVRKAIKDGLIEFDEKKTHARYCKPNTDTDETKKSDSESVNVSSNDDNTSGSNNSVDDASSNDGNSSTDVFRPISMDDVNRLGNSIFTDFDSFIDANKTTYDHNDLYMALVMVETAMASLVNMDCFKINYDKVCKRVISVGQALDAIRRMMVDEKGGDK